MAKQHVAILGAGPVGLEMALAALEGGFRVTVLERGATPAANMRSWGHVTLFSNNQASVQSLSAVLSTALFSKLCIIVERLRAGHEDLGALGKVDCDGGVLLRCVVHGCSALPEVFGLVTPTTLGEKYANEYLDPIASFLSSDECPHATVRCGANVISVGRGRLLKGQSIGTQDRAQTTFRLLVQSDGGEEEVNHTNRCTMVSHSHGPFYRSC